MQEKALGVIETMGLVPAIEAADSGLKTADVTLEGLELVGAGLVAIMMRGDVSSIKAAVAAGSLAAQRLGQVISTTVIARTAEGLECVTAPESDGCKTATAPEPEMVDIPDMPTGEETAPPPVEQLNLMSVVKLRAFARTLPGYPMTREEIRSARKQDLIQNILEYYRKRGMTHD